MLFKRYASPFLLLDGMIQTESFTEFVIEFLTLYGEEQTDSYLWDLFVHSYSDKTFEEFKKDQLKKPSKEPTENDLKATVKNSFDTLNGFNPSESKEVK